jgi:hypothetical protein
LQKIKIKIKKWGNVFSVLNACFSKQLTLLFNKKNLKIERNIDQAKMGEVDVVHWFSKDKLAFSFP